MGSGNMRLTAVLCSLIILISFIGSAQSASCCLRYIRRPIKCNRMLGYNVQTINTSCDINAIIFHVPGRFLCADPSSSWTQRAKECLDERRKNARIVTERTQRPATSA